MYRSALRLLKQAPVSGDEVARVSLICHAMREVMNRAGEAAASDHISPQGTPSKELVRRLPAIASSWKLPTGSDVEFAPVPIKLATAIDRLIEAARHEEYRTRANISSLILAGEASTESRKQALTPDERRWREAHDFFLKFTHLDSASRVTVPDDKEIRKRISDFEQLFVRIITPFFTQLREVQELLSTINSKVGIEDD